jgi:cell division protein FtsX
VFGGVAILVGAFTIFNTLSITVAQRTREFAMLRMVGAARRQVLGSVMLEALALGLIASIVGLARASAWPPASTRSSVRSTCRCPRRARCSRRARRSWRCRSARW